MHKIPHQLKKEEYRGFINFPKYRLFLFTELSSQSEPGHGLPGFPIRRPIVILPRGLQLLSRNGTFRDLQSSDSVVGTPDDWLMGIIEPSGILRPLFSNRIPVKVKRVRPGYFQFVPLTLDEYFRYGYDLPSRNQDVAQAAAEHRNRNHGRGTD